jgi:hypothetical protein
MCNRTLGEKNKITTMMHNKRIPKGHQKKRDQKPRPTIMMMHNKEAQHEDLLVTLQRNVMKRTKPNN